MDFGWDPELARFRAEARAFAQKYSTAAMRQEAKATGEGGLTPRGPSSRAMRDEMGRRGWQRISLPTQLGGQGKSPWYRSILVEELALAGIPPIDISADSVAPALMRFGSEEQKQQYLPGIFSGEITVAIGYSEPDAGTDLASLDTRAVRDGDEWVINGQKIWTTAAHVATHIWLLARTDPTAPKHRGCSVLLIPLDRPGIAVRPLPTMSGYRTNETFYDNVRVPANSLVGEENRGWYIVMEALNHERVTIAPLGELVRLYYLLIDYLKERRPELLKDPHVRLRLAEINVDLHVQRAIKFMNVSIIDRGETPVKEAAMAKIWFTELMHRMTSLAMDLLGRYGGLSTECGDLAPMEGEFDYNYRANPARRFGGGTNEILRDIIAQRSLGLPR